MIQLRYLKKKSGTISLQYRYKYEQKVATAYGVASYFDMPWINHTHIKEAWSEWFDIPEVIEV